MAKTLAERCDVLVGEKTSDLMTIGGYKKNPNDAASQYLFGVYFTYPDFNKISLADRDKLFMIAIDRVRSVSQAPFKEKLLAGKMVQADIEAWRENYDKENFLVRLNEVKERKAREGKLETPEQKVVKKLAELHLKQIQNVEPKDATKEQKATATTWALEQRTTETKNWKFAYKKQMELEEQKLEV